MLFQDEHKVPMEELCSRLGTSMDKVWAIDIGMFSLFVRVFNHS